MNEHLNTEKDFQPPTHSKAQSSKFKPLAAAVLFGFVSLTSGCAYTLCDKCDAQRSAEAFKQSANPPQSSNPPDLHAFASKEVKITAVGYGASSSYEGYTPGQKKLMAMRTSKLDAYRALAEQVQGVRVNGNSTVSAMMAQVDSFRVLVDAYLRGAQIVAVTPMNDGNYETTMELTLDSRFFYAFSQYEKNNPQTEVVGSNVKGAVGPGYIYSNKFYYSE